MQGIATNTSPNSIISLQFNWNVFERSVFHQGQYQYVFEVILTIGDCNICKLSPMLLATSLQIPFCYKR